MQNKKFIHPMVIPPPTRCPTSVNQVDSPNNTKNNTF